MWRAQYSSLILGFLACSPQTEPGASGTTTQTSGRAAHDLLTEYQESFPKYILRGDTTSGLCVDILHEIGRVSGLSIGTATPAFTPFARLQRHLETGRIDLFVGFRKTPAREARYRFLEPPVYRVSTVVAALADEELEEIGDLDELAGERVMIPHGSATAQLVKAQHPLLEVDEGGDIFACLEKLVRRRGRFVVYHDLGVLAASRQMGLQESVKVLPGTFGEYEHYVAVSSAADPDKVARVAAALAELDQTKVLDQISSSYKAA